MSRRKANREGAGLNRLDRLLPKVCRRTRPQVEDNVATSVWEERQHPERLAGLLAGCQSERKLRLLACAIVRHAPFHPDGRSAWDLLAESRWFAAAAQCSTSRACR